MHVEVFGTGPRLVLVHGSIGFGARAWEAQRPLADRYTLIVPTRTGYPPNPPLPSTDFEEQAADLAALLEDGDHLVGHSYGGVVSMLAADAGPPLRSLTVLEPPAFGLARGHDAVERFLEVVADAPRDPRGYLETFVPAVGSTIPLPDPLPEPLEAGARAAIAERPPNEAEIPLDSLRSRPFPKLVVSGATIRRWTPSATCSSAGSRPGARSSPARGTASRGPPGSTTC